MHLRRNARIIGLDTLSVTYSSVLNELKNRNPITRHLLKIISTIAITNPLRIILDDVAIEARNHRRSKRVNLARRPRNPRGCSFDKGPR